MRGDFVIEAAVMYPPLAEMRALFTDKNSLGVYYRDVVLYRPKINEIKFYEVYQNILDTSKSTDSHNLDRSINLQEIAYFLRYDPENLKEKMEERKRINPSFYTSKEMAFQKIAHILFQHTLRHEKSDPDYHDMMELSTFKSYTDLFHQGDITQYLYFFRRLASRYVTSIEELKKTYSNQEAAFKNHVSNLKIQLIPDSKKQKEGEDLKKRKASFLNALSLLLQMRAFNPAELLFLQAMLRFSKHDQNAPFHELWRQSELFYGYKKPSYGVTKSATKALVAINNALIECHNTPQLEQSQSTP